MLSSTHGTPILVDNVDQPRTSDQDPVTQTPISPAGLVPAQLSLFLNPHPSPASSPTTNSVLVKEGQTNDHDQEEKIDHA